jgi:hypothetical protein
MKIRDAIIGFIFLVILIAGALWIFRNRGQLRSSLVNTPIPTPIISDKVSKAFPSLKIPEGANRADLNKVGGGDGVGVATRQKTNGSFNITVLANLPDSDNNNYAAELTNGTQKINLGKLNLTKSGLLVNYSTSTDISSYNKVIVTQNGNSVLEGSF